MKGCRRGRGFRLLRGPPFQAHWTMRQHNKNRHLPSMLQQNNLLFCVRVFFLDQPEVVSNHYLTCLVISKNLRTRHHNYQHNLYWNGRKKTQKTQETATRKWPFFCTYSSFLLRLLRFFAAIKIGCGQRPRHDLHVKKNTTDDVKVRYDSPKDGPSTRQQSYESDPS